jgi:hypothetical protein
MLNLLLHGVSGSTSFRGVSGSRNNVDTVRLCFGRRSHGINRRRGRPRLGSNLPVTQFNDIAVAFLSGPLVWMGYRSTPDQT